MDTQAVVARAIRMEVDWRRSSLAAEMAWHAVAVVDVLMTFAPEERQHSQVASCAVGCSWCLFGALRRALEQLLEIHVFLSASKANFLFMCSATFCRYAAEHGRMSATQMFACRGLRSR